MDKRKIEGHTPYSGVPHQRLEDSNTDEDFAQTGYQSYLTQGSHAQLNSFQKPPAYPSIESAQPGLMQMEHQIQNQNQRYPTFNAPTNMGPRVGNQGNVALSMPAPYNQTMVQPTLPGMLNYSNAALEEREETITLKMPHFIHKHVFQRLFPRKVPRDPQAVQCPACSQTITTNVKTHIGTGLLGTTIGLACCCPALCWMPLCMKDCYDIYHRCPQCGYTISKEKFLCK